MLERRGMASQLNYYRPFFTVEGMMILTYKLFLCRAEASKLASCIVECLSSTVKKKDRF